MESESLGMEPRELILKKSPSGHSHVSGVEKTNLGKLTRPGPEMSCFLGTLSGRSDIRL